MCWPTEESCPLPILAPFRTAPRSAAPIGVLATDRRVPPRALVWEPPPTPRPFPEGPIRPSDVLEPRPVRMDSSASRVHPQHVLAVYAESLVAGARVAVFGDASIGLAARLSEQGAHSVHVWDPDSARARIEAERAP